ncbi:hypothetical protein HYU13_02440 [Candidatus Woesearchaeota archaeon]|nr:hypothetical protein [Candidatus Woesearchaeota archaeon]
MQFILFLDATFALLIFSQRGLLPVFDNALFLLKGRLLYWAWLPLYLAALFLFLTALTAIYALFKFGILFFLRQQASWKNLSFKGFPSFLRCNLAFTAPLLFLSVLASVNIFSAVQNKVKLAQDPVTTAALFFLGIALILILLMILYAITNILQFAYLKMENGHGPGAKKPSLSSLPKAFFQALFHKKALGFLWHDLKLIVLFLAAFGIIHLFVKKLIFGDYFFYLNYYWIYQRFLWAYWSLAFYSLLLFNRIYWQRKIVQGNQKSDRF